MNQLDNAWAAGFIDGEGSIAITKGNLVVRASQMDPIPIFKLKNMYGGSIQHGKTPKGKKISSWQLTGIRAIECLEQLYPYFTVKKKEAKFALFYKNLLGIKGKKVDAKLKDARDQLTFKLLSIRNQKYKRKEE